MINITINSNVVNLKDCFKSNPPLLLLTILLVGCQTNSEFTFEQIDPEFGLKSIKLPEGWEIYSVTQSLMPKINQDIRKEKLEYKNLPLKIMIALGNKSPENTVNLKKIQELEKKNYNYVSTLYLVSHDESYGSLDVHPVPKHLLNTDFDVHDILSNELQMLTLKNKDVFNVIVDPDATHSLFAWLSEDRTLVFQLLLSDKFTEVEQRANLEQFH
jgi:hypothetical protein